MKSSLFFVMFLSAFQTLAQINLNNGLIGCYPFNGNANDLSNSANHGTINGASLTADRFGKANSAYEFNGMDDWIEISAKELQLNEFSYSLWVYPRSLPGLSQANFMFSIGSDYGDQHILLGDHYSNDRHTGFSHGSYLGVANNVLCTESSLPALNQWYHLVLVKDKDNYYFYINNKLVCSNNIGNQNAFYGTGMVRAIIGARNNFGQASNALIDDIHLYNRPITSQEIESLFKGTSADPLAVSLKPDYNSLCSGEKLNLTVEVNATNPTFQWKIDGVSLPNASSRELAYDLPDLQKDYQITIEVGVSVETCFPQAPSSDTIIISVKNCTTTEPEPEPEPEEKETVFVPSAFTPNFDNLNDTWEIFGLENSPELEVWVYSRWGEVIFQSNGYKKPWDGKFMGKLVLPGVYTYKINLNKKHFKSGQLNVLY